MRQRLRSPTRLVVTLKRGRVAVPCIVYGSHRGRPEQESREVRLVPFLDSDNKRQAQGSAFPSREKNSPNKVLAHQQAKLVKSPFQTGVHDGMATFGAQGGVRGL